MSNAHSEAQITERNLSTYSDLFKDLYGFRPTGEECERFRTMALGQQDVFIRFVADELAIEVARDRNG